MVEPIKFPGFFMETKHYAGHEDKPTVNTHNPYAGISQPGSSYASPVQTQPVVQTTVVTQTYSSPPLPVPTNQLRV